MLQRVEVQRTDYLYRKVAKGRPYLYFRFPKEFGVKLVSLPVDEASKAFQHQYDLCRAKLRKLEADRDKVKPAPRVKLARSLPGTIGKAIETYRVSDSFTGLKPGTQTIYIGRLDKLKAQFGNEPLREVNRDAAERMASEMDYLARLDRVKAKYGSEIDGDAAQRLMDKASPQMWDLYITLLSNIWKAARAADPDNVIFGIRKLPSPTLEIDQKHKDTHCQPHLRWPDDLIERFDETAPDYLVLARMVLHFTSQRGGDAVRMKWGALRRQGRQGVAGKDHQEGHGAGARLPPATGRADRGARQGEGGDRHVGLHPRQLRGSEVGDPAVDEPSDQGASGHDWGPHAEAEEGLYRPWPAPHRGL
ncbi:hypothetical protein ACVW0J_005219 [Bradyrhizobium sp. i1.7.7]